MAFEMGRVAGSAEIRIDADKCVSCGLCVKVCKGGPLHMVAGKAVVDHARSFGCITCGHCMAVCPHRCITVSGRDMTAADIRDLAPREQQASYESLHALMKARRSIRNYQDREVPREVVDQIIQAASSAPMGIPPSEVGLLVFEGHEKVGRFKNELLLAAKSMKRTMSPLVLKLMRPFIGQEMYQMMSGFALPVLETYLKKDAEGEDWFFYNAPLAIYFYGTAWADPADVTIAATYAMLAGESLGLGSCMLGFPAHLLKFSKKIKQKHQLPMKMSSGLAVVFGYPAVKYHHALERRFANVQR